MGIKQIEPLIKLYLNELSKKIRPQKLIVFGSYASGKATKESDLDLVVVSKDFNKYSSDERFSLLYRARLHPQLVKIAMDIFGFTPKEYNLASSLSTLGEVKEKGVVVYPSIRS